MHAFLSTPQSWLLVPEVPGSAGMQVGTPEPQDRMHILELDTLSQRHC